MTSAFFGTKSDGNYRIIAIPTDGQPEQMGRELVAMIRSMCYARRWDIDQLINPSHSADPVSWYSLSHQIQSARVTTALDATSMAKNSLRCDYGYVIDTSRRLLELFRGMQAFPQYGNPFGVEKSGSGWYPCKKIAELDCYTLTFEDMEGIFTSEDEQLVHQMQASV